MTTPNLTIDTAGLKLMIGRPSDKGYVNIHTYFDPIKRITLVDCLQDLASVSEVTNVARYDELSGGIAIKLADGATVEALRDQIETMITNTL